jgi:hypothetical protein
MPGTLNLAGLHVNNSSSPQFRTELEKLQDIAATEDSLDFSPSDYGDLVHIFPRQLGQDAAPVILGKDGL